MKIQSGSEMRFNLNGSTLRVNAKCNGSTEHTHGTGRFFRSDWTVKMTFQGRAASFKYHVGEGNADYMTEMGFDDFTECIVMDMRSGQMDYDDFCEEWGHSDSTTNRAIYAACSRSADKMNRVFQFRREEFVSQSDKGDWECLLASAVESLNTA